MVLPDTEVTFAPRTSAFPFVIETVGEAGVDSEVLFPSFADAERGINEREESNNPPIIRGIAKAFPIFCSVFVISFIYARALIDAKAYYIDASSEHFFHLKYGLKIVFRFAILIKAPALKPWNH